MARVISTISDSEFINLQPLDINPLMSKCEVKVFYLGKNRNGTSISKTVALEMAKTLRGAPIVGWFREETQDFGDHGNRIIVEGGEIKFETLTKPYGFISPDAKVWFQKFEELNNLGETVIREYLMTTGYLWTGQYEECQVAVEGDGRPHSMELDKDSCIGTWTEDLNNGMELFIINDAIFSKLCILGEDVEPCFEESSITAPIISENFSKIDDNFKQNLYTMMQDLTFALKGGKDMVNKDNSTIIESSDSNLDENVEFASKEKKKEDKENQNKDSGEGGSEGSDKKEPEEKKDEAPANKEEKPKNKEEEPVEKKDDEEKKKKTQHSLEEKFTALESSYNTLQNDYARLQEQYQSLVEFKNQVEDEKKDALIQNFYMLSDEDKKEVIENKASYSLEDIEAKLSIICVRKKVNFDLAEDQDKKTETPTTYTLSDSDDGAPKWLSAARNAKNNRNN